MHYLKQRFRFVYDQFISLKGSPTAIAFGMAVGVFIGITPTIPFHTALIGIATVLFRTNFTAAYLGSWIVSNPVTIPLLYLSQYHLGRYLLGAAAPQCEVVFREFSLCGIVSMGGNILFPLFVGGILMAPIFAIPSYFITHRLVCEIRKRKTTHDHSCRHT